MGDPTGKDFTRLEYRRSDAWPARIKREWPLLERELRSTPPAGLMLDLGCGSGEHVRHFAAQGFAAVGIDRAADSLALAQGAGDAAGGEPATWLRADLRALPLAGGAARFSICLGNTLVILGDDDAILAALREAHRTLAPGGRLVIQILNYHKLRATNQRNLPLNFRRADDGEELVYVRLMDFDELSHVSFHVITLARRPGADEAVVRHAVRRRLRSLESADLERMLAAAGFATVTLLGGFGGEAFEPRASADVVAIAQRG